jgi:hypothetical protein
MQQVDEDAEALGMIAAGLEPKTKMLEHAKSIAKSARESYDAFKQNAPAAGPSPRSGAIGPTIRPRWKPGSPMPTRWSQPPKRAIPTV